MLHPYIIRSTSSPGAVKELATRSSGAAPSRRRRSHPPRRERDAELHQSAALDAVLDLEIAAMSGGDGVDDREAQAGPVLGAASAVCPSHEPFRRLTEKLAWEPGTVVPHRN